MRDRRVAQQTLDIGLAQRHQVTEDDGDERDDAQHHANRFAVTHRRVQEQTHHYPEDSDFARRRQEGRHRSRCPLVDVWRPQVERHQREFEAKANNHHAQTRQQQRLMQHTVTEALAERHKGEVTGLCVHQRNTKQQERGRRRRQDGVLDACFQRALLAEGVTNQTEQRQRDQLNAEEQRGQVVRIRQQNAAQRGNQNQQVKLFFVVVVAFEPRVRKGTGCQARQQHQTGVQHGVTVNAHQRGDVHRPTLANKPE